MLYQVKGNVVLRGELDYCNLTEVIAELGIAAEGGQVTVDLTAVTFMDCAVLGAIVAARNLARDMGGDLTLANPQGTVRRLLEIVSFPFEG